MVAGEMGCEERGVVMYQCECADQIKVCHLTLEDETFDREYDGIINTTRILNPKCPNLSLYRVIVTKEDCVLVENIED
jgi:hypothetical protein